MSAVLTDPRGNWDRQAFFETGVGEIEGALQRIREVGPLGDQRALDFGCGLGRLTQPLASHFYRVDGVDISESMITRGRALNRMGERCVFHVNTRDDLALFPDCCFDFVYSSIVLQHIEPKYARRYIQEFFRVLRPGGKAVFQIPSDPVPASLPKRTRSSEPLRPEDSVASMQVPRKLHCAPAARIVLPVFVRNLGSANWSTDADDDGRFLVRLGNHWRTWFGRIVAFEDGRFNIPYDIAPGEIGEIALSVVAPAKPGRYLLELDMVQEGVRWFSSSGSHSPRIKVRVDADLSYGDVRGIPPRMEMYGIPRAEVEALIASSGGELLAADANDYPGPGWTSYRYIAQRRLPVLRAPVETA